MNKRLHQPRQGGFTLVGTLLIVAILALVAAASARMGALIHRRFAEQALLEDGVAFSRALGSYARATPPGQPDAPRTLQELLRDPRLPGRVRHLRRIYADPLTGKDDWGIERDPTGRILAIFSLARGKPIKRGDFEPRFSTFAGQKTYQGWKFMRTPEESGRASNAPGGPNATGFDAPVDIDTIVPGELGTTPTQTGPGPTGGRP